jgi:hypothetical protein
MPYEVRFRKPNTIVRQGTTFLYTYLEFYGAPISCLTEIQAYNAAGQGLGFCFTDNDNFMLSNASMNANGTPRLQAVLWIFDNATVSSQAVSFNLWLYTTWGLMLDTY